MAYLGFHKEGAKFSLATSSAYTKGAEPDFYIFPYGEIVFCQRGLLGKGAHGPMPPKYATGVKPLLQLNFNPGNTKSGHFDFLVFSNYLDPEHSDISQINLGKFRGFNLIVIF